jgi:hypothetical protein
MKKYRSVSATLFAEPYDMGGFPIRQPFPTARIEQIDPFILLHHADVKVPTHIPPKHAGVGPHPHRGFSPVTFIFKGAVHHRDSRDNSSIIHEGGVQWMNAGRGIIHSERPPENIMELGGRQEIIQMWVNTPAAHKMDEPSYQPFEAADFPLYETEDAKAKAYIVAGELLGKTGPVKALSALTAATIYMEAGGKLDIQIPSHHNAFIYFLNGEGSMADFGKVSGHHAYRLDPDGDGISISADSSLRALLMSGEALNEKMVAHGPFVMNSETQILEAMRDYQMGKMGVLIEDEA